MKSTLASAALLTSLCISPPAVQAHDLAESIVGTWKLKSFVRKELASGKVANFYGDSPTGYVVYTKSGHYITFVVGSSRKAPSSPNPTDTERLDLFKSMYAYSAKYTVQGTRLIYELDASWNEAWTGTKRSVSAEVAEDTLTITSPPYKSPTDGLDIVVINQWVRVD